MMNTTEIAYLHCAYCRKSVSTGFYPIPTDTPDKGIIVRALIICPECISERLTVNEAPKR